MRMPPLSSWLNQRLLRLPAPDTRSLQVDDTLQIPMRDGTVLLAARMTPRSGGDGLPVALMRGPYGRGGQFALQLARPLAERGFQVVLQSARGTAGSGGEFEPLRNERSDGIDTVEWLFEQPWFGESMIMFGPSYLGYTQISMADLLPSQVKAIIPVVTTSTLLQGMVRAGGFPLEATFGWGVLMERQNQPLATTRMLLGARKRRRAEKTLPLANAATVALGHRSELIQNLLTHDADSPHWAGTDHRDHIGQAEVPTSMITGWFDIFLDSQLRDYGRMVAGGQQPRLTIGPWSHGSMEIISTMVHEVLDFGLPLARGEAPVERAPVRAFVMGAEQWRDLASWPPPNYEARSFYLQPGGALTVEQAPVAESEPSSYHYDPADPTPAVGGVRLLPGIKAGRVDNRMREQRDDVLTYISEALAEDLEIVGAVAAKIWFGSSSAHADVFIRVCDVDPSGRSMNVCEGITGLTEADELDCGTVELTSTAYLFKRGHRIRIQVSSGSFPQYNRNLGTGEPRLTATRMLPADQQVFHDPAHPSAVLLPVRTH
ncbi:CocE/NonD family hydrolase [Nocardia sp. NPDC005745]|uniref:CocE/NonD family hydrolase n=1 Tax=Nocardia sp. NPDC005745 TaxID=3157061 RepID=UPI0033CC6F6B